MNKQYKTPKKLVAEIRLALVQKQISYNELSRRLETEDITAAAVRQKWGRVVADPDTIKVKFACEICRVLKLSMWVG